MIVNRFDKVGYITPEDEWLRNELKEWAEKILFSGRLCELDNYPIEKVRQSWKIHQSGENNMRWHLWPYLSLAIWLEMVENNSFAQKITV